MAVCTFPTTFPSFAALALLLARISNAHMIMATPKPYGNPDNSPLASSGANFPCKVTGDPATFYSGTTATSMAVGENQTLSFTGSAVHGGGSCQLAITSDKQPSASTQWQVILSIESGCPSTDGTSASTYQYSIPSGVASGDYVFAWTWVSKLSGTQEYYMNCAPITVTGGASKRSEDSNQQVSKRATLPNLFVANLASVNDCKSTLSSDVLFPDPGENVQKPNPKPSFASVSGTNCFPAGATGGASPAASAPSSSAGSGTGSGSGAESPLSSAVAATSVVVSSAAVAPTQTTLQTTLVAATPPTSAAAAPTATSASSSGGSSSSGTTCSTEGAVVCIGTNQFGLCNNGAAVAQDLAAGTTCSNGVISRRRVGRWIF